MSNHARSIRLGRTVGALAACALGLAACGTSSRPSLHRGVGLVAAVSAPAGTIGLVADPEAAKSYPQAAGTPAHAKAISPEQAALASSVSPGAPSDAEVRAELRQLALVQRAERSANRPGTLDPASGTVTPPAGAPGIIKAIIAGANAIASFPYRFGGGHASFIDNAYDCSGSLSYALAAGGLVSSPLTSGDLERWGVPGPGRYLTVFANAGHTFMFVDGLRYDTSGRAGPAGSRWQDGGRSVGGFVVRHWPGL